MEGTRTGCGAAVVVGAVAGAEGAGADVAVSLGAGAPVAEGAGSPVDVSDGASAGASAAGVRRDGSTGGGP